MSADILTFPTLVATKTLTPHDRLEALLAAEMNDERAELCTKDQPALKKFFAMNAALLKSLAR